MFKELRKIMFKELKGTKTTMNQQVESQQRYRNY